MSQAPEGGPAYYFEPPSAEGAEPEETREPQNEPPRSGVGGQAGPGGQPPYYGPRLVWEPPPPPVPRHTAPRTSFWLGGRVGWFVPFGNAFSKNVYRGSYTESVGVRLRDYASSGPFFEVDVGARIGRHYTVFGLWERAELGIGNGDRAGLNQVYTNLGGQTGGDTDFWAAAVRISSDPDEVGLVSELGIGYRRARIGFEGGEHLELTQGTFEARIGVGADIRVNRRFSLSPMLTLGVGMFGQVDLVRRNGDAVDLLRKDYNSDGHGWFTLHLGGHFDIAGRP
ncbi:MAG TPA: hypothetical protein VFQ61_13150 [Polyangiaceae bacterium]|nr:hypothetical protein [Polyangiaceae bacterium]